MKNSIINKIISMRLTFVLFLLLTACGSGGGPGPGPGPAPTGFLLGNWQWLRPLPSGNELYDITFVDDDYVAVGSAGTIYTSVAGLVKSGTPLELYSVAFGNGMYLAVGKDGTVLSSSTGTEWTIHGQIDSNINGYYVRIAFGKNTFVVASGGNTYTSQDNGVSWTKQYSGSLLLTKVYFANNQFIVTTGDENILTSPDGIIWTQRSIPIGSFHFNALCFGQGKYVASNSFGSVYTSIDAKTWTYATHIDLASSHYGIYGLAYGNGLFVAVGGIYGELGSIYTSTDAVTWKKQEETFLVNLSRVVFTGTRFVAIGKDGLIVESGDGLNWTEVSVRLTKRGLNSIAYGNGLLIAPMTYYSEHALYLSADGGVSWTTLPALPGDAPVNRIKFMDGLFYAFCGGTVYTSPDGFNWTTFYSSTISNANFRDIIHVNNIYILVGRNPKILTSNDGLNWTERSTGPEWYDFTGVTYGNNVFVAVCNCYTDYDNFYTSEDGLTWSSANIYVWPYENFVSVAYGNKQFVAVGHYGSIYSSSDGKNWINRIYGGEYEGNGYLSQVIYTKDGFVAVGWDGLCYTSLDGKVWTKAILPGGSTGVAYGANSYYVSGWPGAILKSDKVHLIP